MPPAAIVTVAVRDSTDVLAAVVRLSAIVPEPDVGEAVSQGCELVTDQLALELTVTDVTPPPAVTGLTMETANVVGMPTCVTAMVWAGTPLAEKVRMAVRGITDVLAVAEMLSTCVPVPKGTLVESQASELVTVQLVLEVIVIVEELATFADNDRRWAETLSAGAAPACVTVIIRSAAPTDDTVTTAVREAIEVLVAAVSVTI